MRKGLVIGLATFAIGIFLMGIGGGVAFAEYSSFEYGGIKYPEGAKEFTYEKTFSLDNKKTYRAHAYFCNAECSIVEDDSVAKDEIMFRVKYRSISEPGNYSVEMSSEEIDDDESRTVLSFYRTYDNSSSDFEIFMKAKDQFLKDLKEHKLCEYRYYDEVECVEILVNPKAKFNIEL